MTDPIDPRRIVADRYDRIADRYARWSAEAVVDESRPRYTALLLESLPHGELPKMIERIGRWLRPGRRLHGARADLQLGSLRGRPAAAPAAGAERLGLPGGSAARTGPRPRLHAGGSGPRPRGHGRDSGRGAGHAGAGAGEPPALLVR